jgi:hypothetical protein
MAGLRCLRSALDRTYYGVTSNWALAPLSESVTSFALSLSSALVLIEHPLNAATPPVVVAVQPESVPEPLPIANVMALVSVVTVLPPASSIVTTGWMPKGLPATASPGCVVKTSWAGAPG